MADGQVVFEINGDNRKLNDVLRDTTSDIEREGKKWDKAAGEAGDSIQDKFTKVFKAVAASAVAAKVGKALLDFGKDAIQAASDLEEVQNVVDVTFGDGASQIEKWAKSAGQQFGLTETQAKKFTSTLGAMMKSAGRAGPEIVNMSTDLAGLAADMASFYNLDFDTAFQKIRSGISGETEPLKQLGINMSVANLEAFALTQGITKAFNQMSQGEQTMLRYQYLMQATADAQGDFARTSDGYANSVRKLETNIEQLKTSVGTVILPIVSEVVQGINDMIGAMTQTKPKTVLDEFAEIDLKTSEKLAEIQQTADEANALIDTLEEIGGKQITSTSLTSFVDTLTGKINGLDGAMSKAKTGDYAGTISEIAGAMAAATGGDAGAWNTLLTAIGDKLPDAIDATLDDKGQTAAFLEAAGAAADSLGGEYPTLWAEMLGVLGDDAGAAITALANGATAAAALEGLANGANALNKDVDANKWKALLNALSTNGNINLSGAGRSIEELASALNGTDPGTDRAQAWQELLAALSADVEGLSALTGTSAEETAAWLSTLAEGANTLDPNSAEGWGELFGTLVEGLPGLQGTEYSGLFEGLNGETSDAEGYLKALGYETDDITDKQKQWLEVCQRLVKTIPGLSSIINTETGEINGGVDALRTYVEEWHQAQNNLAMLQAIRSKREALNQQYGDLENLKVEALYTRALADRAKAAYDAAGGENAFLDAEATGNGAVYKSLMNLRDAYEDAELAAERANSEYSRQAEAAKEALEVMDELESQYGETAAATEESTAASEEWTDAQKTAAGDAIDAVTKALEEVEKYYDNVSDATKKSIDGVVSGFKAIETPAEQARDQMADLTKQIDELNAAGKDSSGVQKTFQAVADSIPSVQNMTMALQDQLAYLEQYQHDLDAALARGVSEDILATLADGSVESADYLRALATQGTEEEIKALNEMYAEVEQRKQELSGNLTTTRLNADDEFQGLVEAAQAAADGLDVYSQAESAMESTVQGIADGIAAKVGTVQAQVDALNNVLGGIGGGLLGFLGTKFKIDGSHAMGLDYVPFNNYLAQLHEGESILTAEEARVWRSFKNGGESVRNTIDYEAMGGLMRDNIKPGGNVYLDGRIVGQVISQQQGNSLRTLERSGWQK